MPGQWEGRTRAHELPPDWATRIVPTIKARDSYRCTWHDNGQRCTGPADEVDHIERGNCHEPWNLRSLCRYHHRRKTSAEGNAARWRVKTKRPPEKHPGLID